MTPRHIVATLLTALSVSGCYKYAPMSGATPEAQIVAAPSSVVKLTLRNRVPLDMRNPRIHGDSVVGYDEITKTRIAIPMSLVSKVEVRSLDGRGTAGATAATIVTIGVAFFLVAALAVSSSLGGN